MGRQTGQPACPSTPIRLIIGFVTKTPRPPNMSNSPPQNPDERTAQADNGFRSPSAPFEALSRLKERIYHYLYGPKPAFLTPLSWILTLQLFTISVIWYTATLPIRIALDIYERRIRVIFPQLPSVRTLLLSARMAVLALYRKLVVLGVTSFTAGSRPPQGGQGPNAPVVPLPTLPVDLDGIRAGKS
ncbi:hypothetical protein BJV78DRAFT_1178347 [Lactifluus subvellereus]|nr:hypothetical protein BJV78DRAFT_1178347 [Lactifluus subvellereus]